MTRSVALEFGQLANISQQLGKRTNKVEFVVSKQGLLAFVARTKAGKWSCKVKSYDEVLPAFLAVFESSSSLSSVCIIYLARYFRANIVHQCQLSQQMR